MDLASAYAVTFWAHWRVLLGASNTAWWASELWIFARDLRRPRGANADRASLAVIVLVVALSLGAAMQCRGRFPFANMQDGEIGALRFSAGLALMWVGVAFRLWAVVTLGRFFRIRVTIQDDHRLITQGPFKHLRNPSYAGALTTFAGQGLTYGNWFALLACVAGPLIALAWRIHVEETALRARFGDAYDAYAKQSWALVPWIW